MTDASTELTGKQKKDVEDFLHLFGNAEAGLKRRLGRAATDRTGVSVLMDEYEKLNPLWSSSANLLRRLAEIRNLLTHQRGLDEGSLQMIRGDRGRVGQP